MTPYTEDDLRDGWEFKIVRSAFRTFRDAGKLEKLCRDEARAGWVLLEKFDDSRLRFKRPASARKNDAMLEPGIDPYRTWVGASETRVGLTIGAMVVGAILLGLAVAVRVLDG